MRILLFLLLSQVLWAQLPEKDSIYAARYITSANALIAKGKYADAELKIEDALKIYLRQESWSNYYTQTAILVRCQAFSKNAETAFETLEQLLEACSERLGSEEPAYALLLHQRAWLLQLLGQEKDAGESYHKAAALFAKIYARNPHKYRVDFFIDWAAYLKQSNQRDAALQRLQDALFMAEQIYEEESPSIMEIAEEAAVLAYQSAQYQPCKNFARKAVNIKRKLDKKESPSYYTLYFVLGKSSVFLSEAGAAKAYSERGLEICEKHKELKSGWAADFYQIAADAEWLSGNFESAISLIEEKRRPIVEAIYGQNSIELADVYQSLGLYYNDFGKADKAKENLIAAIGLYKSLKGNRGIILSTIYSNLADCYQQERRYSDATKALYSSVFANCINCEKEPSSLAELAAAAEKNSFLQPIQVLYLLYENLSFGYTAYQENKDAKMLLSLATTLKAIEQLQEKIWKSRAGTSEQAAFLEARAQGTLCVIPLLLELSKLKKDKEYLKQAYRWAQKQKHLEWAAAIWGMSREGFARIPDSLLLTERRLQEQYLAAEKDWAEAKLNKDESAAGQAKSRMLKAERERREWETMVSQAFPRYFELMYKSQFYELEEIQNKLLDSKACLLDYFVQGEYVYLFRILKYDIAVFELDLEGQALSDYIEDFNATLKDPLLLKRAPQTAWKEYAGHANKLFKVLLAPALADLPQKTNRLLIAPDGPLYYLPFEALLTSMPKNEKLPYSQLDYLIKKYAIGYAYSGFPKITKPTTDKIKRNNELLAVAASYQLKGNPIEKKLKQKRLPFAALLSVEEEMSMFSNTFKVKSISDSLADEARLKAALGRADFIHLAAYSYFDEQNPLNIALLLSEGVESDEDNFLYANEMVDLSLKAELLVLSACHSGYGLLDGGEALQVLTSSVSFAGTPSVLLSLWPVNHPARVKVLKAYYKHLAAGKRKDVALQAAKLDYLASADEVSAHPLFWAAFVQTGDLSPLGGEKSFWSWSLLYWLLLPLGLGLLWWRRRKLRIGN